MKPDNMLISEKGYIKLGDLGLAIRLESPNATITDSSGTPSYLAPEQYDDKTGLKSDIWALGMSAIEMANGKHPYEGKNQYEVLFCVSFSVSDHAPDLHDGAAQTQQRRLVEGLRGLRGQVPYEGGGGASLCEAADGRWFGAAL